MKFPLKTKNLVDLLTSYKNYSNNTTYMAISSAILECLKTHESLNLKTIALKANCSNSTITKFAQTLGFDGAKEFFYTCVSHFNYMTPLTVKHENEIELDQIKYYHKKIINNLSFAYRANAKKLEILAKYLSTKQPHIFLFGKGANLILIQTLANYLLKLNFHVNYALDLDIQMKLWSNITDKDCVIWFSYSGITSEINELFAKIATKPFQVVFTANQESNLYLKTDLQFLTNENEEVLLHQRNNYFSFLYLIMQLINLLTKPAS